MYCTPTSFAHHTFLHHTHIIPNPLTHIIPNPITHIIPNPITTEAVQQLEAASQACTHALVHNVPAAAAALEEWWKQPALEALPWATGVSVYWCIVCGVFWCMACVVVWCMVCYDVLRVLCMGTWVLHVRMYPRHYMHCVVLI